MASRVSCRSNCSTFRGRPRRNSDCFARRRLPAQSAPVATDCANNRLIYLVEVGHSLEALAENVNKQLLDSGRCIVVVSEGYDVGSVGEAYDGFGHIEYGASRTTVAQVMANYLNDHGLKARGQATSQVPGVLQRCTSAFASTVDIEEAFQVGRNAVEIAVSQSSLNRPKHLHKRFACMPGWARPVLENRNDEVLVQEAPLRLSPGEPLRLRVFLDGCMLEVFANGRQALCQQIWPTRDDSLDVRFLARDGDARINTLIVWEMKAACPVYQRVMGKESGKE